MKDEAMHAVVQKVPENMKAVVFADDLMVRGNREIDTQEQLDGWNKVLKQYRTKFSVKKCELIIFTLR